MYAESSGIWGEEEFWEQVVGWGQGGLGTAI